MAATKALTDDQIANSRRQHPMRADRAREVSRPDAKHCTHLHALLLSCDRRDGVMVMRNKLLDRPITLLAAIGGVLLTLWIAMGYGPEDASTQSAAQRVAQTR
jgi:hypothetical protein